MKLLISLASISLSYAVSDFVKNNVQDLLTRDGSKVVRLGKEIFSKEVHMALLEAGHEVDVFGDLGNTEGIDIRLSEEAIQFIQQRDLEVTDTTEEWIGHFESNYNDPSFFCTESTKECAGRDLQSFYNSYQNLDAIHARVDDLAANSNIAEVDSLGTSYQGRDLKYVWIGEDAKTSSKPLVFYQCNIHAREWLSPMYCTYMIERLLDGSTESQTLLDRFSFAVLPSLNPDGYVYSTTTNSLWRKTRKPNSNSNCIGTDLNRNWDDHHCGQGASTDPCSETFCGPSPFDNVETAAVRDFANTYSDRLFSFADIHSYGGYWMSPWGWTTSLPPAQDFDRMEQCFTAAANAVRSVNGLNFIIGSSAQAIYVAAGGSDDWFYSANDVIYAWSVELRGNSFQPSATNIMPSNLEIFAGMAASLDCAYAIENDVPTPSPTPVSGCTDSVPSGITVGGVPTPCPELDIYCSGYDFVRENCPVTCGTCTTASAKKTDTTETRDISSRSLLEKNGTFFTISFTVVGIAIVLLVVGLAVRKNKNDAPVELAPQQLA